MALLDNINPYGVLLLPRSAAVFACFLEAQLLSATRNGWVDPKSFVTYKD